ncbi:MAG TPA: TonB-dependent receptor [Gammaproteobacteria bacterium]
MSFVHRSIVTTAAFAVLAALPRVGAAQNAPPQRLEEIVVTSSMVAQTRRQIGTAVSVVDIEEIELRGYASLAEVLRTQTGIGVTNAGGPGKSTAVRIRGEDSFRTVLIVDGIRALDPSAPQVAPTFDSLLTTSDFQRVEVLRGPQGFLYGADAGGVVNVITQRGADDLGGRLGLEYGDHSTRKIDGAVSGGGAGGDYFLSVVDYETDGFNSRTADTVLQDDDGAENTTLHAKLGWNWSENLRLQLVARNIDAENSYDSCFVIHDCFGTTEQAAYKVSAEHAAGNATNVLGYSTIDTVRDDYAGGAPSYGTEGEIARFEYTGSYKGSEVSTLVYGLDFQDEELASDEGPRSRDNKGYYVEYQGAFENALFVSLGARYDDNDDFGTHTSSRLSLAYVQQAGSGNSVKYRASVGTGFRAPSLYEIAYNNGPFAFPPAAGSTLTEESSQGYDVGIEYDTANGAHFEVTYFEQEIEDEVYFDLVSFSGYLQSNGISTSKGFEVAASLPLGPRWSLLANWLDNEATDTANQQRLQRPENLGNFGLMFRGADERLGFIANYRVVRDSIDVGSVAIDDYEVLDLSMTFDATESFQFFARIENATDEEYQELVGYNTAERSIYGGVRFRF